MNDANDNNLTNESIEIQNEVNGNYYSIPTANQNSTVECKVCYEYSMTDNELLYSIYLNGILGVIFIILFLIFNQFVKIYRIREISPSVENPPQKLPKSRIEKLWKWFYIAITTRDVDILISCGLDALMFQKTLAIGIQLFLPFSIIALCVLFPLHKQAYYNGMKSTTNTDNISISLASFTASNVDAGSQIFWIHFVCVYVFILYTLLVLYFHHHLFVRLKHHYFNMGDSPNEWRKNFYDGIDDSVENRITTGTKYERTFNVFKNIIKTATGMQTSKHKEKFPYLSTIASSVDRQDDQLFNGIRSGDETKHELLRRVSSEIISEIKEIEEINVEDKPYEISSTTSGNDDDDDENMKTDDIVIFKWWKSNMVHKERDTSCKPSRIGAAVSKPTIENIKTINIISPITNTEISVNAQQYCILLTDVPQKKQLNELEQKSWFKQLEQFLGFDSKKILTEDQNTDNQEKLNITGQSSSSTPKQGTVKINKPSKWTLVKQEYDIPDVYNYEETPIIKYFKELFEKDFSKAIPIRNHKLIDDLLFKWDKLQRKLAKYKQIKNKTNTEPMIPINWWSFLTCNTYGTDREEAIKYYKSKIKGIEAKIDREQKVILKKRASRSWILIFKTQRAAAIASQTLLHSELGYRFKVQKAPGPDEINWQALWIPWYQKDIRTIIAMPLIIAFILIPLGILVAVLSKSSHFICDIDSSHYTQSYCQSQIKNIVSSWLPSFIVVIWQELVMPNVLYYLVQFRSCYVSYSDMDIAIASLYHYFNIFNIFLGAMLTGSILPELNNLIHDPSTFVDVIGKALPDSSNFFVSYVAFRAICLVPYHLLIPHPGFWAYFLKLGGHFGLASTKQELASLYATKSLRYGVAYGIFLLMFLITFAYSVISPVILPISLVYFTLAWIIYRYQILYVYVRKYESGGNIWPRFFKRLLFILWLFQFFTSCFLLIKQAYFQSFILWVTVPVILINFNTYSQNQFKSGVGNIPLDMAHFAPSAKVDPNVYTPPSLIKGCTGWYPEYMKAWDGWRVPAYTL